MIKPTTTKRAIVLALPAAYVAIAAAARGDARPGTLVAAFAAIVVAVLGARRADREGGPARDVLAATAGASIAIATSALAGRPPWAVTARAAGVLVAAVVAARSIARIDGDPGLAASAAEAQAPRGLGPKVIAWIGLGAVALAWATPLLVDGLAWIGVADWERSAPVVAAVGGALSLFALGATALFVAAARKLELYAPPRALAIAASAGVALVAAFALAIGSFLPADAAVAVAGGVAALVVLRIAKVRDVARLARLARRTLSLAIFGGPLAVLGALNVSGHTYGSEIAALVLCVASLLLGAYAKRLEEPFLPENGLWLDALEEARDAARTRGPRATIAHALLRMRQVAQLQSGAKTVPSPELWMLHPTRVWTVDAAGYLHEKAAELPPAIFEVASDEPHATLRTSVLKALEVRRPDLRPLLRWLEERDALCATVIAEGGEPDGLLVITRGRRHEPLTLDEAAAAKRLADAFASACQTTSARERHLAREHELKDRIDELEEEIERLGHAMSLDVGRNTLATARLARPATVGIYSAASRMAFDALERRVEIDAPVVLLSRPGMDPVPYVARAHLGGRRSDKPLVVVDGTSSREHDPERWRDRLASPLALADRGVLLLVDGAALPREVQTLVARTLAERRAPWEHPSPLDVVPVLTATSPLERLVDEGRLSNELFARFSEAPAIVLPGLSERPEDLRSIVADRLAREGLRVRGRPVGIEAAAFARLVEHPFDGEDAELATIVSRLVALAEDDVVRTADVDALGFVARPERGSRDETA